MSTCEKTTKRGRMIPLFPTGWGFLVASNAHHGPAARRLLEVGQRGLREEERGEDGHVLHHPVRGGVRRVQPLYMFSMARVLRC